MKKKWSKCIIILLAISIFCIKCGAKSSQSDFGDDYEVTFNEGVQPLSFAELGRPMTVDGVMELTLNDGGFFDDFYAYNETLGGNYMTSGEGKETLIIYGVIKNLSSKQFEINRVTDITVLIDGEYEYTGYIYPQNSDGTAFVMNAVYEMQDKIQPKAERTCALICGVGSEVAAEATTIKLTINVKQHVDADEDDLKKSYVMNLVMNH